MNRRQSWVVIGNDLQIRLWRRWRSLHEKLRYRLGLPTPDLGDADLDRDFRHPVDAEQMASLTARYRELFPEAAKTELAEADRLTAHHFAFLGHPSDHGKRIAWSRDPISGRDWSRGFSPDITFRESERLGDIKLPWEINKHQYFFTLGKAVWLRGDPAPAREIIQQIDEWIEDNPYLRGINWISAMEVGMRAISWILAFPFYADCCDTPFRRRLARSLAQHILFVERNLSRGRFANNHLIGEATALVAGGLFLKCRQSPRWVKAGLAILEEEMQRQTTSDGIHVERSVSYHRFILDQYYLVNGLLTSNERCFPSSVLKGMEIMTNFLVDVLFPDGSAPAFGDADDARGLWFRADSPSDFRSLLALGAVLFQRPDFKAAADGVTEEVLWLMGLAGVAKFQELDTRAPDHTSAAYPDGGYYIMRGGWGASDPVLVFDCGPLGHGSAGHGHADALSFQLWAGGYAFLVDSGTYSYNLDYRWRNIFRSTRAHNTVVIDGEDQSETSDRMSWKSMAAARCRRWLSNPWFDLVDGEHDGYCRLADPVKHRRMVVFLKPDTWVVWDHLSGIGPHDLEFLLHLKPDCVVERGRESGEILLRSPSGCVLCMMMPLENGLGVSCEIATGSEEETAAWYSPGYGRRVPAQVLALRNRFIGERVLVTCFSNANVIKRKIMEREAASWIDLKRDGLGAETILCRMVAEPRPGPEGVHFDGEFLYRREIDEGPPILWAVGFHELSIKGILEVRSVRPIETLVLEKGCCMISIAAGAVATVQAAAREGIRIVINGNNTRVGTEGMPAMGLR